MPASQFSDPEFIRQMMLARLAEFGLYAREYSLLAQKQAGTETGDNLLQELAEITKEVAGIQQRLALLKPAESNKKTRATGRPKTLAPSIKFDGVEIVRKPLPGGGAIRSLGYHENRQMMDIEFRTGKVYRYFGVPAEVAEKLEAREGQAMAFFSRAVRNVYEYKEIGLPTKPD